MRSLLLLFAFATACGRTSGMSSGSELDGLRSDAGALSLGESGRADGGCGVDAGQVFLEVGASGLVNPLVEYAPDAIASWSLEALRWEQCPPASLSVDLSFDLVSGPPEGGTYVGSLVLLQVWTSYRFIQFGDWESWPSTPILVATCEGTSATHCRATVAHEVTQTSAPAETELWDREVQFSWVRVFAAPDGTWRYQWLQSDSGRRLPLEQVVGLTGKLLVYVPLADSTALHDYFVDAPFDYAAWAREHLGQH